MDEAICHRDKAKGVNRRELQRVVDLLKQHIEEYVDEEDLEDGEEEEEDVDRDQVEDEYIGQSRSVPSSYQAAGIRNININTGCGNLHTLAFNQITLSFL